MKRFLLNVLSFYYEILDWLLLLVLLPFKKSFSKNTTFFLLNFINFLHFFYLKRRGNVIKAEKTLEDFRTLYDKNNWNIYDLIDKKENWLLNKKILDIGCFVGGKAECFINNGAKKVVGVDLSKRGISVAKKYEQENLIYLNKSSHDIIDDYKNYFDTIVSFTVFEHIEECFIESVISDAYKLLNEKGKFHIVFNHYLDRFGSHMADYIYFSHPTIVFNELYVNEYCNKKLRNFQKKGLMGYYPVNFTYSNIHNSDSYMALNKINSDEFINLIQKSEFKSFNYVQYSKTRLMKILSSLFPKKEIFKGSFLYMLEK